MIWFMIEMLIGSILIFIGVFGLHWLIVMIGLGLVISACANITYFVDKAYLRKKDNGKL